MLRVLGWAEEAGDAGEEEREGGEGRAGHLTLLADKKQIGKPLAVKLSRLSKAKK